MDSLSVRGVSKSFGNGRVVDDVSFEVQQGELLTLLGPSGCGKTTTLRMIAGLESLDSGEIALGDRLLSAPARRISVPPEKRSMGMVFQSYAVWPHMTVFENVAFPLKMKKVPRREIGGMVSAILATVGLAGFEERPATMLSGGQQQRVALARSLVFKPDVLLLDEPFSNLDAQLREEMRFEVKDLQQRLGLTMVFVTHDQKEAIVLSDRIIVMNAGRIEQEGSVEQVYRQPANRFVFGFLGKANYLQARVRRTALGATVAVVADAGEAEVPIRETFNGESSNGDWKDGADVTVAFRPEDVTLGLADGAVGAWTGRVHSAVVGSQIEYVVDLGSSKVHAFGSQHDKLPVGALVRIGVREEAIRIWSGAKTDVAIVS
ncbi:MAG TPA: ABC transporter ATP-binding protein [Dehalococcoidia bacterium]|nr:ABC transporter ATP-binding protein [Dehalococcoidia bacterium]